MLPSPPVHAGADWIDRLYATLRRPARLFSHGWGLPSVWGDRPPGLDQLVTPERALAPKLDSIAAESRVVIREGTIESPVESLPPEARSLSVRVLEPKGMSPRAAVLFFGAWGDETFALRTRLLAPLAREGIAVWLPATPFFGKRRAHGQRGVGLRTVHDFLTLGHAAVEEACALLQQLRADGHTRLGVAGFSMGGQLAALTAVLSPLELSVMTVAASVSPASVFCRGPLGRAPDWQRLEADGRGPALPRLRRLFERYAVTALAPPKLPERALILGTERDLIVPPEDAARIAEHWPGAQLRWLRAGHVAAIVLHAETIRRAIRAILA